MSADSELAALQACYGTVYQIWYVPMATVPGPLWCARRLDETLSQVFHADTSVHLAEEIDRREADRAAGIPRDDGGEDTCTETDREESACEPG